VFCSNANYGYGPDDPPPGGNLYRVRPDGSDLEQLTFFDLPTPGACDPRYTPDGKWIVFTVAGDIWVMPSQGGEAFPLLTGGTYSQPDWQP
jgi:Tol biopolymer transport system component